MPGRRARFYGVRQGQPVIVGDIADLQIVTVGRGGVITLEGGDVNVVASGGVDARSEAALFEFRLHPTGIPWRDPCRSKTMLTASLNRACRVFRKNCSQ